MSGVSLPVTRPLGRALVVGAASARPESVKTLAQLGYDCAEADDPYAAFADLCNHRLAYHAVIISIASLYREELAVISAIKRVLPHIDVWLTQTDGRQAALAEGIRLGADGLLAEDGLHRIGQPAQSAPAMRVVEADTHADEAPQSSSQRIASSFAYRGADSGDISSANDAIGDSAPQDNSLDDIALGDISLGDISLGEPVLSSDELRALLQDQPNNPPMSSTSNE
jgi:hypothetical protein